MFDEAGTGGVREAADLMEGGGREVLGVGSRSDGREVEAIAAGDNEHEHFGSLGRGGVISLAPLTRVNLTSSMNSFGPFLGLPVLLHAI